jgi:hypothetical protein
LIPLFPIGHYTPASSCPHAEPIVPGSALCCMICHCSGLDAHPALHRDPLTDPAPEPKAKTEPAAKFAPRSQTGASRETRKQKRLRLSLEQTAASGGRSEKSRADVVRAS